MKAYMVRSIQNSNGANFLEHSQKPISLEYTRAGHRLNARNKSSHVLNTLEK